MSTKLDANQVLKRAFDDSNDRIKVDAEITATLGTVEVVINHTNDSIRLGDGTDLTNVTAAGELNVLATAQPGTDIGDVTINNATGAGAVNVQDGGNSLTIDNANLVSIDAKMTSTTAILTSVARSVTSQTVLSSNVNRKGFILHNDTGAVCFIAYAATATTSSFTFRLTTNSTYESTALNYTGVISVIWGSGGGSSLLVTELT